MKIRRILTLIGLIFMVLFLQGCANPNDPYDVEQVIYPTPANNLSDLIEDLNSDDILVQIVSTREIFKYGEAAGEAIPSLINNLHSDSYELRRVTVALLSEVGESALIAIPDIIWVMKNDKHPNVRTRAVISLGKLGDPRAIPALANNLYQENQKLAILSADAIASITGERFTDAGRNGYTLNDEGVALILLDAQKWWEEIGQYQDWPPLESD